MAEPNSLLPDLGAPINPQFTKPKSSTTGNELEQLDKLRAIDEARRQQTKAKVPTGPVTPEWGKTIGSGVQKAAASIAGIPGDVGELITAAPALASKGAAALGLPVTPQKQEDLQKTVSYMTPFLPAPMQALFRAPTTEQISEFVSPAAEKVFGVGPQYQPKTEKERIVKGALEYGLPSIVGGPAGAARRVISGVAGAGAAEFAKEKTKDTWLEPYATIGTAILAPLAIDPLLGAPAKKLAMGVGAPMKEAKEEIAGGLSRYGAKSGPLAFQMSKATDVIDEAKNMPKRMREFSRRLVGVDETSPEYAQLVDRAGSAERDRVYGLARANPVAQSIDAANFGDLTQHELFKEAEAAAKKNAAYAPEWEIHAPKIVPAQFKQMIGPGGASFNVQTAPESIVHGNLAHYDQIKRELDTMMNKAYRAGDDTLYQGAKSVRDRLVSTLDEMIPEYGQARGVAASTFKTSNAVEAGRNFYDLSDEMELFDFKNAFQSYNDDQKKAFRVSYIGRLEKELATKNITNISNKFLKNPQFMEKMEFAFGPEGAGQIRSKVLSENMLQKAASLAENAEAQAELAKLRTKSTTKSGLFGLASLAATDLMNGQFFMNMLASSGLSPLSAAIAVGTMAVTGTGIVAMNAVEKRIANRMVKLIKENDPKTYSELNGLIDKHPSVYPKIMVVMQAADQAVKASQSAGPKLPQENLDQAYERLLKEGKIKAQADGGRVARASGGRIDIEQGVRALMNAAENAKKSISKSTENLLKQPDEHIAQALNVAKRHI